MYIYYCETKEKSPEITRNKTEGVVGKSEEEARHVQVADEMDPIAHANYCPVESLRTGAARQHIKQHSFPMLYEFRFKD